MIFFDILTKQENCVINRNFDTLSHCEIETFKSALRSVDENFEIIDMFEYTYLIK